MSPSHWAFTHGMLHSLAFSYFSPVGLFVGKHSSCESSLVFKAIFTFNKASRNRLLGERHPRVTRQPCSCPLCDLAAHGNVIGAFNHANLF